MLQSLLGGVLRAYTLYKTGVEPRNRISYRHFQPEPFVEIFLIIFTVEDL